MITSQEMADIGLHLETLEGMGFDGVGYSYEGGDKHAVIMPEAGKVYYKSAAKCILILQAMTGDTAPLLEQDKLDRIADLQAKIDKLEGEL